MGDIDPKARRVSPGEVVINPEQIERFKEVMDPHFQNIRELHRATSSVLPTQHMKDSFNVRMSLSGRAEAHGAFVARCDKPVRYRQMMGYGQNTETIELQGERLAGTPFLFQSMEFCTYKPEGSDRIIIAAEARGFTSKIERGHYTYETYWLEDVEATVVGQNDLTEDILVTLPSFEYSSPIVLIKPLSTELGGLAPRPAFA